MAIGNGKVSGERRSPALAGEERTTVRATPLRVLKMR